MNAVDWQALERMRAVFLEGTPVRGSYWRSESDLANYDATLGERIGWKWDAALTEVARLGWKPPPGSLLDFGCGSGVAGRRVMSAFGTSSFTELRLHDKSPLAEVFATERARSDFPGLPVRTIAATELAEAVEGATLVVSHVLSEMTEAARARLLSLAERAAAILWVEPGTHADSHALISMREALRGQFGLIAPCTHGERCGLLAPGNERHWCHFFGRPPWEIFTDPDWAEFAARMGVDLRSLPFSYLVLERQPIRSSYSCLPSRCCRVIGEPRFYKGYARLFSCAADGVAELTWPKREAGDLFKAVKDGSAGSLFRFEHTGDRIKGAERAVPEESQRGDASAP
ncbi:MAG TPA: small ribosomal subunit Rsm22 family protein [Verrucomicrobiota bacterium]|nr:hypothetical protein [Verrucomicrobiales bacterium]HRI14482.1 small ribosomal subunit Rsm22 family protein [Verrucomicrobiota bacterium]